MAYVLLAIGALMVVSGLYAVVTGYPIIQVEQGWASVIAGATLIAGGFVTIALGLILRTLQQWKAATRGLPEASALRAEPAVAPLSRTAPPTQPDPDMAPAPDVARPFADVALEPEPVPPPPPVTPSHADSAPPPYASEPVEALEPVQPHEPPPDAHDVAKEVPVPEPAELWTAEPEVATVAAPEIEDVAPVPAASHAPPPDMHPIEEPATPPMDDWLDRAFAEIDRDLPPPARAHLEPAPPVREAALAEHAPALAESAAPAEAPVEPPPVPAAPSTSAVIGRYEADGTSYVMYADGSIEAQSEGGIYRFASMAELKTFIEG